MVFSSVPAYPDPPIWPHHHQQQSESGVDQENGHVPPVLPLPPLLARGGGGDGGGGTACTDASKPGSMSNRAKLAKLPQLPDTALKCPRCDSTNTKFCYFNNYNLSQPRHFCKTCRRYWTRGGALRNVPVGGGCRRNKRSKTGSRSKSPATSSASISAILTPNSSCTRDHNLCHLTQLPPPKLPFLPSSLHLTDYGLFEGIQNAKYGNTTAGNDIDHLIQIGSSSTSSYSNGKFSENWRMHQSHLLETPSPNTAGGMYQFEMSEEGLSNYGGTVTSDYLGSRTLESGVRQQQVVVDGLLKMEDSNYQGLNLSKKLLGISGTEDQYSWAGINSHAWSTNASEFASSSASHVL